MGFPVCALFAALLVLFASPAVAAIEVPRGSPLTFEWTPAAGAVSWYHVYTECNGGERFREQIARSNTVTLTGLFCDTVRIRVAAFGPQGSGPLSEYSRRIRFVSPPPPSATESAGTSTVDPAPPGAAVPGTPSDFDGDGMSDLLLRNRDTGAAELWSLASGAAAILSELPTLPATLDVVGDGDLDADGDGDLLLWDRESGQLSAWLLEAGQPIAGADLGQPLPPGWRPAGHADFDGDGRADLLLQSAESGELELWSMDGLAIVASGPLSHVQAEGYRLVAAVDCNRDGRADLVWHDAQREQLDVWTLDGRSLLRHEEFPTGLNGEFWYVAASGDFDGDGQGDLLWRNRIDGRLGIWFLDDGSLGRQTSLLGRPQVNREVLAGGDWNGDGKADLLLRRRRGGLLALLLDGASELSLEKVGSLNDPWFVANVGSGPGAPAHSGAEGSASP